MPDQTTPSRPLSGATTLIVPHLVRTHLLAISPADLPLRLLVAGTAGSGKSRILRHIAACFTDKDQPVLWVTTNTSTEEIATHDTLLVDDAHLLDDERVEALSERVRTSQAGVIVAARPWPWSPAMRDLSHELEHKLPTLVLGRVTRADVVHHLDENAREVKEACIDAILDLAGHLSWLVSEALAIHDDESCTDDERHCALREGLRDVIAHRTSSLDPDLRQAVESLCVSPGSQADLDPARWADAGHAEGLLQRNGQPAPVVIDAVRATTSIERLIELYAGAPIDVDDATIRELVGNVHDVRVATALLRDGDAALVNEPRRAAELFRAAGGAGADPHSVAVRRAAAEWARGDIDAAGALLDSAQLEPGTAPFAAATAIAGAVWAARGDLRMASAVYDHAGLSTPDAIAHSTIAAVASGDQSALESIGTATRVRALPSTVVVSQELLVRGLRASLTRDTSTILGDLVRASEAYTASLCASPVPELPAVIAAVAAMSLGELGIAHTVIDEAVRSGHGGAWARPRLLLWQAWIAVQRERPHEAESAAERARAEGRLTPREQLLSDAVDVALTRRYADPSALAPVWRRARESILRTRFDLFSMLLLGEFAMSAARLGDLERVQPHLDEAYAAVDRLGAPPVWSAPLHWAGLHCAITQSRQDQLAPHAKALLAAAPHTRSAHAMATAGRVWTEVLTGKVDAEAVEHAALGLASVGLAWDGARLAGQGAARSDDRRVIARLLACARQLHPREELERASVVDAPTDTSTAAHADVLSAREREVASLVLQGKTYAEIGESIFISPRTAEHHIARIRRRLGATSRSDLMTKLRVVLAESGDDDAARVPQRSLA